MSFQEVLQLENDLKHFQKTANDFETLSSFVSLVTNLAHKGETESVLELLGGKIKGNKKYSDGQQMQVREIYLYLMNISHEQHASINYLRLSSCLRVENIGVNIDGWGRLGINLVRQNPGPLLSGAAVSFLSEIFGIERRTISRWISERPKKRKGSATTLLDCMRSRDI